MRQCKSAKLLKKTILLQLLVDPDQSSMFCQFPMINQTYSVNSGEFLQWLTFTWGLMLRVEVVTMKYELVYTRL